jgi:RNA polymerase sigma-70 factor (ECF subfamily)
MPGELAADILNRLQLDDRSALKELFEAFYPMVCQAIRRLVQDAATCEDLAQEVFLRFWQKRHKINIDSNLPAYLRRMAINEALAYHRRNKRYQEDEWVPGIEPDAEPGAEEQYLHGELKENITAAVDSLPPKCRMVFQLSRYEELTYREIADKMGISVKTVENQMSKALRTLRDKLQAYLNLLLFLLWSNFF